MAEEFQALLNRINEEGLKKADAAAEQIIFKARAEADKILSTAREEADSIVREAKKSADILLQKGEQSLKQASRSVLLDLRAVLESRVSEVVGNLVKETLTVDGIGDIIASLCQGFVANGGNQDDISILLNASQFEKLENAVRGKLSDDLRKRVTLVPSERVRGGFQLTFKGNDVMYDFTDQALAECIAEHLSANIVKAIAE